MPETLVRGVIRQNAKYDKGKAERSVTQLIMPPQIDLLRKAHFKEMEKDISEEWFALFGSAVHYILELGIDAQQTPEERLFLDVNGWTISGAIDLQTPVDGGVVISDYKVTTAYPLTANEGEAKKEWEEQVNMQAYLVERVKNVKVVGVEIVAIVRDWERRKAAIELNYPAAPVVKVPVRLWSREEQEAFILNRVMVHQDAEMAYALGEALPECSPSERWAKGDKWVLMKVGGKRASKTFYSREEAEAYPVEAGYEMQYRPGKSMRCDFCGVSQWCDQYNRTEKEEEDEQPQV